MGLFGKKRRSSTEVIDTNPTDSRAINSAVISTATASTSSTRHSSMRKPPVRPQPTFERIAPPPVQPNEISILRDQVLDLERAFNDKDLFDFLLADIDRNRLTQIVTMFADSGQYVDMQGAMELAETLDRLIRRRLEETHEQQRRTLIDSQTVEEPEIGTIITEAESTDLSTLTVSDLQNRISYFDYHFYRSQDGDFALLLRLSERIESFRKALRELESRGSIQNTTPEDVSHSHEIGTEQIQNIIEGDLVLPPTGNPSSHDDEEWETFTPAPPPIPISQPTVCSTIYGPIETRATPMEDPSMPVANAEPEITETGTDIWERFHNESSAIQGNPQNTLEHGGAVEVYRISSSVQQSNTRDDLGEEREGHFRESRAHRLKKAVLCAWLLIKEQRGAQRKLSDSSSVLRLRSAFSIWIGITRDQRERRDFEKASAYESLINNHLSVCRMRAVRSCFYAWSGCSRESKELQGTRIRVHQTRMVQSIFAGWRSLCLTSDDSLESHIRFRQIMFKRAVLSAWITHIKSSCDRADMFYKRSLWNVLVRRVKQVMIAKEQASLLEQRIVMHRKGSAFAGWKELLIKRRSSIEKILIVLTPHMRDIFHSFKRNSAVVGEIKSDQSMEIIAGVLSVVLLREKRTAFDTLCLPLVVTPKHRLEMVSPSIQKSPIVQYYSISDPEEAPQATPPPVGPIEELKQSTNDIIVKTQVFLSQRRLRSPSAQTQSQTNLDHSRKVIEWLDNHKRSSDNYFTDFERKWAIEEQKWHL
jgi:hypothetical protein